MNTAELLIRCLENEGVQYIFGLPGEENLHILEALKQSKIQFITTRHEQGAAFMADVYGRLTGKAGVCLSTLGPGATNLMTGVADANLDRAPLIAITGQVSTDRMHIESHQYLDLVNMFEAVTRWSQQVVKPQITPELVRRAFKIAQSDDPGAVHIDLPEDIAALPVSGEPLPIAEHEV
jgi:acetolactate synthase I/II/III large subunit